MYQFRPTANKPGLLKGLRQCLQAVDACSPIGRVEYPRYAGSYIRGSVKRLTTLLTEFNGNRSRRLQFFCSQGHAIALKRSPGFIAVFDIVGIGFRIQFQSNARLWYVNNICYLSPILRGSLQTRHTHSRLCPHA